MELPPPPLDAFATYLRRRLAEEGRPPLAEVVLGEGGARLADDAVVALVRHQAVGTPIDPDGIEPGLLSLRFSGPGFALFDRFDPGAAGGPPEDFDVLAIVTTFNEADIVGGLLERLRADAIRVHVIDNWSTDGTAEIVAAACAEGGCTMERFPSAGPTPYFELKALLRRVEEVAHESGADWVIHHDADEVREGPWPGVGLRRSLFAIESFGFNCADHTVVNFLPVDDSFTADADLVTHFRHFEFGDVASHFCEQKAWKPQPEPVQIAETGGHEASFADRRVFPYKFLLRHYPIRSQAHGERKIFRERQGRFHPGERAAGWHIHYDEHTPGTSFLRDPAGLLDADDLDAGLLLQRLSGAGLAGNPNPGEGPETPVAGGSGHVLGAGHDAPAAALRVQLALSPLPPGALGRALGALARALRGAGLAGATDLAIADRSSVAALGPQRLDALAATLQRDGVRALCYEHVGKLVSLPDAHSGLLGLGPGAPLVLLVDGSCVVGPTLPAALVGSLAPDVGVVFARRLPVAEPAAGDEDNTWPEGGRLLGPARCALVRRAVLEAAAGEADLVAAAAAAGYRSAYVDAPYVVDAPFAAGAD